MLKTGRSSTSISTLPASPAIACFISNVEDRKILHFHVYSSAKIVYACLVLAALAFGFTAQTGERVLIVAVTVLTLASIGFYVREWVVHMSAAELEG